MAKQVFPTKGNLMAAKKSLELANMGYDLLDKKRNVLIKEMMNQLDDVKIIRDQITEAYERAYAALQDANMSMGFISDIAEDVPIDDGLSVTYRSIMGVELPRLTHDARAPRPDYGLEQANSRVDETYLRFNEVKELTVKLAEVENSVYRLANAIRQSQTRANALKNISIPQFEKTIKTISEALEEKERESFSTQKVIKAQKERKNA